MYFGSFFSERWKSTVPDFLNFLLATITETPDRIWVVCNKLTATWVPTQNCQLTGLERPNNNRVTKSDIEGFWKPRHGVWIQGLLFATVLAQACRSMERVFQRHFIYRRGSAAISAVKMWIYSVTLHSPIRSSFEFLLRYIAWKRPPPRPSPPLSLSLPSFLSLSHSIIRKHAWPLPRW